MSADESQAAAAGDGDDSDSDDEDPAVKWRRKYEERQNHRRASSQNPRADTGISLPASNDAAALEVPAATAAGPGSRRAVTVAERLAMIRRGE